MENWEKNINLTIDYFVRARSDIIKRLKKVKKLEILLSPDDVSQDMEYLRAIKLAHDDTIYLFSLGFNYAALDHCRKIIEIMLRRKLGIEPRTDLFRVLAKLDELDWEANDIVLAKNLYQICSKAIHVQHQHIYEESQMYSELLDSEDKFMEFAKTLESFDPEEYSKHRTFIHGVTGLENFTLKKINEVFTLVEKYCL